MSTSQDVETNPVLATGLAVVALLGVVSSVFPELKPGVVAVSVPVADSTAQIAEPEVIVDPQSPADETMPVVESQADSALEPEPESSVASNGRPQFRPPAVDGPFVEPPVVAPTVEAPKPTSEPGEMQAMAPVPVPAAPEEPQAVVTPPVPTRVKPTLPEVADMRPLTRRQMPAPAIPYPQPVMPYAPRYPMASPPGYPRFQPQPYPLPQPYYPPQR